MGLKYGQIGIIQLLYNPTYKSNITKLCMLQKWLKELLINK